MVYRHVAVGGTFDNFHKGHKALLNKAVEMGDHITIGITSDAFAGADVEPYEKRKESVEEYIKSIGSKGYKTVRLEDPFGPAKSDPTMDAIIVSEETYERAVELNVLREKKGLNKLKIFKIPMLLADDGKAISSSRIRDMEIDINGRLL